MDTFKPLFDIVAFVANVLAATASGIAIYLFIAKRKELSAALQLLLNYSFQTTLSELKEKLERLNEYRVTEAADVQEIQNILHEIAGQIRGNARVLTSAPDLPARLESLAASRKLSEPAKRAMVAEVRETLRTMQIRVIQIDSETGK